MALFRMLLLVILLAIVAYTAVTITNHGINLFPDFFGDMATMNWPGQFNFDFMCFLVLSALWVAWRNAFSGTGLALAIPAFFGGALFLSIYLLYLTGKTDSIEEVLIGPSRHAR